MPVALVLPPDLTTKLAAVNILLQSIGESPVNSVDVSQAVDVASASATIDEVALSVQSEGWPWNSETSLPLGPDTGSLIQLPNNCLFVGCAYWEGNPGTPAPITERARQLYDTENHTYLFTQSVLVDMVLKLEWEEMPEYARRYITIRAAQLFQGRIQSSRIVQLVQQPEVDSALAVLEQARDKADPLNSITGNRQQFSRVYGRNMRRRS